MGSRNTKQPLAGCVKPEGKLERDVLIVCTMEPDNVQERKRTTGLHLSLASLNRKLDKCIGIINIACRLNMPYMKLRICKAESSAEQGLDIAELKDLFVPRIIVEVNEIDEMDITEDIMAEKDISHLIRITLDDRTATKNKPYINETYCIADDELENVIQDILLDIAAYHSWDIEETQFENLSCRRDISSKKSAYAKRRGLKCRYKPDGDSDRYFSFASACYDSENRFDIQLFNEIWEDFMKSVLIQSKELVSYRRKDALAEQLKYYSKQKNVPVKKLEIMFDELPTGSYILMRTEREPKKNPRCRGQLITYFGMYNGWKTGKLKFIQMEKYHEVVRWYPYVSLWKIVKGAA